MLLKSREQNLCEYYHTMHILLQLSYSLAIFYFQIYPCIEKMSISRKMNSKWWDYQGQRCRMDTSLESSMHLILQRKPSLNRASSRWFPWRTLLWHEGWQRLCITRNWLWPSRLLFLKGEFFQGPQLYQH